MNDLILFLTVGGAYVVGSIVLSIVAMKLLLDRESRRG